MIKKTAPGPSLHNLSCACYLFVYITSHFCYFVSSISVHIHTNVFGIDFLKNRLHIQMFHIGLSCYYQKMCNLASLFKNNCFLALLHFHCHLAKKIPAFLIFCVSNLLISQKIQKLSCKIFQIEDSYHDLHSYPPGNGF